MFMHVHAPRVQKPRDVKSGLATLRLELQKVYVGAENQAHVL